MPPEGYTCTPECKGTHAEDQAHEFASPSLADALKASLRRSRTSAQSEPVTEASDAQVQAAYTRWLLARADKYSPPDGFDTFLAGYRLAESR